MDVSTAKEDTAWVYLEDERFALDDTSAVLEGHGVICLNDRIEHTQAYIFPTDCRWFMYAQC
ncbi:hypothetical protein PC110_g20989 [Phytophthora cactorum]|uniref:Uncharacterized protein n=1 Tax=Phytophthora cactorum TaxID=29920 RepID=A0A329RDP8_9STRA|nr:hypothetical protein PC110_g20989 [Phytophthora cactorum]